MLTRQGAGGWRESEGLFFDWVTASRHAASAAHLLINFRQW